MFHSSTTLKMEATSSSATLIILDDWSQVHETKLVSEKNTHVDWNKIAQYSIKLRTFISEVMNFRFLITDIFIARQPLWA
jgi:hypothetical protein